jgi:fibronectin type 3 domain-containing protein
LMGWGALIESVAPGETKDFQFLVAAPSSAPLGSYEFTITATDAGGDAGPVSAQASAAFTLVGSEADTDPPTAPTGLTGSCDGASVSLTWNPASDAASGIGGYHVYRDDSLASGFGMIGMTSGTSYGDTGAALGDSYQYMVRAFDTAGNEGPDSNVFSITVTDTLPPDAPTGLEAAVLPDRVDLSWDPASDNVAVVGYEVLRNGAVIASTSGTVFSDSTVASGATYDYTVRAFDAEGNTGPGSSSVVVEVPAPAPDPVEPVPAPVNLRVTKIDLKKGKIQITWADASDDTVTVTHFQVFRDAGLLATTDRTKYDDKKPVLNTTYVYSVRAVASDGRVSADSSPVVVIFGEADAPPDDPDPGPDTEAPSAPADLRVSYDRKKSRNKLQWTASTDNVGVVAYDVIRDGSVLARVEARDRPRFHDQPVTSGSTYRYAVVALDAAGNRSPESSTVAITVP